MRFYVHTDLAPSGRYELRAATLDDAISRENDAGFPEQTLDIYYAGRAGRDDDTE